MFGIVSLGIGNFGAADTRRTRRITKHAKDIWVFFTKAPKASKAGKENAEARAGKRFLF